MTLLLTHPAFLEHATPPGHPERADRLRAVNQVLAQDKFKPLVRGEAPEGNLDLVTLCHNEHYVGELRHIAPTSGLIYIDGDTSNPSINGTGEEDYFLGSYAYWKSDGTMPNGEAKLSEHNFSSAYSGFYSVAPLEMHDPAYSGTSERHIGEYRWHILDPIRFDSDIKVTIQGLGWQATEPQTYLPLRDYYASVAYWYQTEPHAPFPMLPDDSTLQIHDAK